MPATVYYDNDADLSLLKDKTIAIIGYGESWEFDLLGEEGSCFIETSEPSVVYVYHTSWQDPFEPSTSRQGDPSMVWIPPVEQRIDEVTFCTFDNDHDFGSIANHYVNVVVHRLDQETSGLVVLAKNKEAHKLLQDLFASREVKKTYIALLQGYVMSDEGVIDLPLRPDVDDRPRQMVDYEHGKAALTDYEVLGHEGSFTRLALMPHTGRTHQLRVHCAHAEGLGTPIVGDRLYGHRTEKGQRLCLHAAELAFQHPLTGERMSFSSVVPF